MTKLGKAVAVKATAAMQRNQQLELLWTETLDPEAIAQRLRELDQEWGKAPLADFQVRVRRNRSTLGSMRFTRGNPGTWCFSVAEELIQTDPEGALALGKLLLYRARHREPPLDLRRRLAEIRARWSHRGESRRRIVLCADPILEQRLLAIAARICPERAADRLPSIGWVESRSRRVLARYDGRINSIEVHDALRTSALPAVVLDNLIHHELLHAVLGPVRQGERMVYHHKEFRRREQAYPGFKEAEAWTRESWPRRVERYFRLSGN